MKKLTLNFFISIFVTALAACSAPELAAAPGPSRSTQPPQPPPPPQESVVEVTPVPDIVSEEDPLANLSFKNGWARIPFNATVFGGYGADQMNDVINGGPGVIAVGFNVRNGDMDADVWTSSDGINWIRNDGDPDLGGGGTQMMNAVASGPNGIVAVGFETIDNRNSAAVWFSEDGFDWIRLPIIDTSLDEFSNQVIQHVTTFGDGFVAVGIEKTDTEIRGAVWVSANGSAWQRVDHSEEMFGGQFLYVALEEVMAIGGSLIAAGTVQRPDEDDVDAGVWVSQDEGKIWTQMSNSETALGDPDAIRYQLVSAMARSNNQFLIVGTEQNRSSSQGEQYINGIIWQSLDGVNWERIFDHKPDFHQQTMLDIVATELGFVVVGYDQVGDQAQASAWISPDGVSWTQVPHFESLFGGPGVQRMNAVTEGGPGLVAVGITSENGEQDTAIWIYIPEK